MEGSSWNVLDDGMAEHYPARTNANFLVMTKTKVGSDHQMV